ncbi:neprilysin-1-like [Ixodes scapularis]
MSKERSQRQPPLAALDEKSQSEPRPEPSASALVEHGDSRRPSVSVNEGDLGSMPPVGEHPRKSLGSLDFGDSGPEKSDPLTAAPVSGDNVDIAKEFLEGIWGGSEESPPKSPLTLASLPEVSNEDIRLKPLESLSGVEEEEGEAYLPLSSEPQRDPSENQVSSPKKDKEDSVSSSTGEYTTETRTETATGSTSATGETEEETHQTPPTPPPTQASVQRPESRPSSGGSDLRSSDTEGLSTDRTSESESTESLELGKEDMEAPLLPKKESDRKAAEVPKVVASSLGTKEIMALKSHAPPLSSSSTAKSSTTKTSSGAQIQPSAFSDAQTKRQLQKAAAVKKATGEPGSKVAGNDPAQCARNNNEAHRDAETEKRTIPCILLVLNIIVAIVLILLYHLLLIRELERRAKEERPEAFIPSTESVDNHVCRSVQCSAAGTHLFYVLNTSANPCRSIYDYVCKSWIHLPPTSYRKVVLGAERLFVDTEPMPRWRSCLADVNDVMPLAIGSVFVDHGLWRDNQFKASRIVVSLLEVLAIMFERWPEDGTRSTFSGLRNDMDFLISYPFWIKHAPTLDAYYDGVKSGGDYFDRYVSASRVHYQNYLLSTNVTQRHRPLAEFIFPSRIVDLKLLSGPARENVFYDSRDNTLILPAGALQPPYYDISSPLGLVFGGLGTLIARDLVDELFHTPEGVLKEDQSKNVFSRKSQCLLDEMMKGMASNASLDSSSVITDVFTLRVAFEGYHIFMGTEEDNTLQGVAELTPDQLFFISAVRTLCTNIRERHFAQVVLLKKSVTEMKLIDTAVMQMREFDDTFHCEKKDSATLKQNLFNKCVYTSS